MSQNSVRLPRRLAVLFGSAALALVAGCDLLPGQSGTVIGSEGSHGNGAAQPTTTNDVGAVADAGPSDGSPTSPPSDTTAVPTPPIPVQTSGPCNFPTTVPGGTVPPNLCPGSDEILDPPAVSDPAPPPESSFTCPDQDYPIVQFSTSWTPYTNAATPIEWCGSGGTVDSTEGKILLPTEPFPGIAAAERVGVELNRMPGGIQSFGTVAIPSAGPRLVQLKTRYAMFPLDYDEFAETCEGLPERTVRGVPACVNGNDLVWDTDEVFYTLTVSPELNAEWDDVIAWTNTWVSR